MAIKSFSLTLSNQTIKINTWMTIRSLSKKLDKLGVYNFEFASAIPYLEYPLIDYRHKLKDRMLFRIERNANSGKDKYLLKITNGLKVGGPVDIFIGSGKSSRIKWIMFNNIYNNIESISHDLGIQSEVKEIMFLEPDDYIKIKGMTIGYAKGKTEQSKYIVIYFN